MRVLVWFSNIKTQPSFWLRFIFSASAKPSSSRVVVFPSKQFWVPVNIGEMCLWELRTRPHLIRISVISSIRIMNTVSVPPVGLLYTVYSRYIMRRYISPFQLPSVGLLAFLPRFYDISIGGSWDTSSYFKAFQTNSLTVRISYDHPQSQYEQRICS